MPSLRAKMEYLKSVYRRYHKAVKETKGRILEEFCKVCHYHRKHAIRLLNAPLPEEKRITRRRRSFHYGSQAIEIAGAIWEASGYLCAERLKVVIQTMVCTSTPSMPPTLKRVGRNGQR